MQKINSEIDIAGDSFDMLTHVNAWLLTRHQWIIKAMRCLVTGETLPDVTKLVAIETIIARANNMPESLQANLKSELTQLNNAWLAISKAGHPLSGSELFHQLDEFQAIAEHFMQLAEQASQRLWQHFTMRDALTGTWTRLTLHASLSRELKRAERHGHHCCIALLDQNEFKGINDLFGHATGDKVLIETAHIIGMDLRSEDTLFRYGGDEWLILMPTTSIKMASQILQRLCKKMDLHSFISINNEAFQSSLSYGVAESLANESVDAWIARADSAMYQMKNARQLSTANHSDLVGAD